MESTQTIVKNIFIVDDHPFIIEGYKNGIALYNPKDYEFLITQAKDCESSYNIITNPNTQPFDIAFLDISMPSYDEKEIFSGEDIAKLLLEYMPNCKIILLTMYTELLKLKTIIKNINPNGLIIKNDLTFDELMIAFDKVLNKKTYYSQSVINMLKQAEYGKLEIDQFDKEILFHLSKGTKEEDIPQYVPITLGAVQRRKTNLKELLKVEGSDFDLVQEAKTQGILF